MALVPIYSQPGLCQDSDTGQIINMRDFTAWEETAQFQRNRTLLRRLRCTVGEMRLLEHWAVVLHPWHEVIPPSLTVDLIVNDLILVRDMPLFRIAEPLKRSADCDLERRLLKLEAAMNLGSDDRNPSGKLRTLTLNQNHSLDARINGPADDLAPLMEMTKHFMLRLQGTRRFAVVRRPP
jgi:hypothetical protein